MNASRIQNAQGQIASLNIVQEILRPDQAKDQVLHWSDHMKLVYEWTFNQVNLCQKLGVIVPPQADNLS